MNTCSSRSLSVHTSAASSTLSIVGESIVTNQESLLYFSKDLLVPWGSFCSDTPLLATEDLPGLHAYGNCYFFSLQQRSMRPLQQALQIRRPARAVESLHSWPRNRMSTSEPGASWYECTTTCRSTTPTYAGKVLETRPSMTW